MINLEAIQGIFAPVTFLFPVPKQICIFVAKGLV